MVFGFLNIHKPSGPSSHDIVWRIRRGVPGKPKVGHAGTLDPFAEGVLVLCVGPATRLASYLQTLPKRYEAVVTLGTVSDTDDRTGSLTPIPHAKPPQEQHLRDALSQFVGQIDQTPPAYSAVYIDGIRAYHLARDGEIPDLPARSVRIDRIDLLDYSYPHVRLDIRCGSGTYIRSLARDLGKVLETGGHCSELVRTAVGPFTLDAAHTTETLRLPAHLIAPQTVLNLPSARISDTDALALRQGRCIDSPKELAVTEEVVLLDQDGQLVAIAAPGREPGTLRPRKTFPPEPACGR